MELKTIKELIESSDYAYDGKTIDDITRIAKEYIKEFQRQRKEEFNWGMIDLKIGKRVTSIGCRSEASSGIEDFINHFFNQ